MSQRARPRTGDQALVREINLSVIMNQLREHAPISRATLAEMTGLNKTTVSSLVHELIQHHFVHEVGLVTSGVGRPAVLLELNPAAGCIVSAEIGVDFISVIRTNFTAEIVWRHKEPTERGAGQQAILDRALALLCQAVESHGTHCASLLGLAVGVPGLVDHHTGNLLFAPNLGWRNVPLGSILRDNFAIPVFVDNEANLAALGEYYFGAAQDYDEVLYVSVGVGLGGGIVRHGSVFRGKAGFAGEFGHMTIEPDGRLCNCGNHGCWETRVSTSALFRYIEEDLAHGQSSLLTAMTGGDLSKLSIPFVVEAARQADPVTLNALEKTARYLGLGIASLVNALDPELVILGGMLSPLADFLLPTVREEMLLRTTIQDGNLTEVVLARHGYDACVMGGVATVYQNILAQPATIARQIT